MEKYRSNLKAIRTDRDLTIDQLAEGTGIAPRTIISIENDNGANPQIGTVKRLLKYFEITFEELYPR